MSWEREVERGITQDLALDLADRRSRALGIWEDSRLGAIISWRNYGNGWLASLIAVDLQCRGSRYAERLIRELAGIAVAEGIEYIYSVVHKSNTAMIHISRNLRAECEDDPNSDDYLLYVLDILSLPPVG